MPIASDFSVDRATGNIRHVSGATTYSVLQLHRFLQDLADDASAVGDDQLDITDVNPSERATDNIITLLGSYNIDDTAAQYLYNGSITQKGGDEVYAGLLVVGSVVAGTQLQVIQNGAVLTSFWGTGINADSTLQIVSRMLIKTRTAGADIDGQRILVVARELGNTYDEFPVTCTPGNNVAAIQTSVDLNNQTASGSIAAWTVTNTEGYQLLDVDNDGSTEPFYSQLDQGVRSKNDLYEKWKYWQRRGSSTTLYGLNGFLFRGITHQFDYNGKAGGTFVQNEVLSWGTGATAGTARLLAASNPSGNGTLWIQLLTGVAPSGVLTITGATSGGTGAVNGAVVQKTIDRPTIGKSTGTAIIGGYGMAIKVSNLTSNDRLTDLNGVTHAPPNSVTFTVAGLVSGDRVLVAPWNGVTVDSGGNPVPQTNQLTLSANLTGAAVTSITMTTPIPADTPTTGTIRVVNNAGYHVRVPYTSWSGSTFTVTATNFAGTNETAPANSGNGSYITYIDKTTASTSESFSAIYAGSDRQLMVRVRDGAGIAPIKTYTAPATLTSAGGTTTAIRTTDA